MKKVRVVLADDNRDLIAAVCTILGDDFEIVQTAENGNQAVSAVLNFDPDVLVTDISMAVLDGLQAARIIRKSNARVKIIFLSIHEDIDFIAAAMSAGGVGYVTKPRLSFDLIPAIRDVLRGHTFVSSRLSV